MGVLKFLFIAIAVGWLVRLIFRLTLPWAMRKMAQKVMGDTQRQAYGDRTYRYSNSRQPDGKVRIDYVPPQNPKKGGKKAGEFVDFEEIKSPTE